MLYIQSASKGVQARELLGNPRQRREVPKVHPPKQTAGRPTAPTQHTDTAHGHTTRTPHTEPKTRTRHTEPTHGPDTRNRHTDPTHGTTPPRPDTRNPTHETDTRTQHTDPAHGPNTRTQHTDPTHGPNTRNQHTDTTHGPNTRTPPRPTPASTPGHSGKTTEIEFGHTIRASILRGTALQQASIRRGMRSAKCSAPVAEHVN